MKKWDEFINVPVYYTVADPICGEIEIKARIDCSQAQKQKEIDEILERQNIRKQALVISKSSTSSIAVKEEEETFTIDSTLPKEGSTFVLKTRVPTLALANRAAAEEYVKKVVSSLCIAQQSQYNTSTYDCSVFIPFARA